MNITTDMQSINNLPIVNPFSNKIINNRLSIPSRNLNNELYLNIKYNIKKNMKVEPLNMDTYQKYIGL